AKSTLVRGLGFDSSSLRAIESDQGVGRMFLLVKRVAGVPRLPGAPMDVGALFTSGLIYFFLGSRFSCRSSGVTVDSTPPAGTSSLQSHTRALSTTFRWLSSPQFLCRWPPVNPKPRPPPSRSTHHIMVSSWPDALTMWS